MAPPTAPQQEARPRAAIVGTGMIGEVHRRAVRAAGGELAGVLGSTPARSRAVGRAWGTHAYADLDELLADGAVDVVHLCTPNHTHAGFAGRALAAGRHVVCEKPLGVSGAEAEALTRAARDSGLVATVPFVYRYHPLVRELRRRRQAGEFGDWNLLHGSYLQDWMLSPEASGWRVDPQRGGPSRAFADIGSHWCDLVEWVSGERFTELTAASSVVTPERPAGDGPKTPVRTEDCAALLLRTARGVLGSLTVSQVSAGRKNRLWFELDGAAGSAVFDQERPETVWLGGGTAADGDRVLHRGEAAPGTEHARLSALPPGHPQGYADCFAAFVADTYAAIAGVAGAAGTPGATGLAGELPEGLPTFADGLRAARLADAFLSSSRTGNWTKVTA
ncbi:Gfo/Idh/MocA family oxidoreductase [Streptomyces sp. ODS28]|uniref:Gfo/Idh/MocA family protein n=1 Tax=Streptomyces sp. ODS28 TaxID=3136688 RepID=UPI0031EC8715